MTSYCVIPIFLVMFAVPYINAERDTASDLGADFLYPHLSTYRYSTPSWQLNGSTAPRECKAEGKAVPSFYLQPYKHNSVMPYTEKNVCAGCIAPTAGTCPSHENARLRLSTLRQSIKSWMDQSVRTAFPEATKTRCRLRKLPRGRMRYCASVRSHGVYLSFSTYSLTAFSRAVSRAGAVHCIHHANTVVL